MIITVSQGNINNGHFYFDRSDTMIPADAWGGKNKSETGVAITIDFSGTGEKVHSDIDGAKRIFRCRRSVCLKFFEVNKVVAGDQLALRKVAEREFVLEVFRSSGASLSPAVAVSTPVKNYDDEKSLTLRKTRNGQNYFKTCLLEAYQGRCAVTGCDVVEVLEAAHIKPHAQETDYNLGNGILLRADIHKLFDAKKISIGMNYQISIDASLEGTMYADLQGRYIQLPKNKNAYPIFD